MSQHAGLSDRKSTRLNSSHVSISYAVFCLKKKMHYMVLYATWLLLQLSWCVEWLRAPGVSQDKALNLARCRLGQLGQELNPARVLKWRQPLFDERFEFLCQRL